MNIWTIKRGAECEIQLVGRLDTMTAPEADRSILELAEEFESLILDLAQLEYISSAGLRVLKRVQMKMREKNGSLALKNVGRQIMEILEITGFKNLFRII